MVMVREGEWWEGLCREVEIDGVERGSESDDQGLYGPL